MTASLAPGRRFLRDFLVIGLAASALWAVVVLAFDPFLAFGTRLAPASVIRPTSRMLGDEQLIKDHLFSRLKPDTAIVGSSRALYGFDPGGVALRGANAFNLSMMGAQIDDLEGLAAQAVRARVRRLIMGVDHYMFFLPAPDEAAQALLDVRRRRMEQGPGSLPIPLAHLSSFMMSTKVGRTIGDLLTAWRRGDTLGESDVNGLMHGTYRFRIADRGRAFEGTLRTMFEQNWYAPPDEAAIRRRLMRLAGVLRRTCGAGVKVDVVLSPEHAMLYEAARLTGSLERRETLRREMARLVALMQAELPDCLRYRDASGLSEAAAEPLRPLMGAKPQFIEVSHYAPSVGERVLAGFGAAPDAIGLDPADGGLEADISRTRRRLDAWRAAHPDDAAFVERVLRGTARGAASGADR